MAKCSVTARRVAAQEIIAAMDRRGYDTENARTAWLAKRPPTVKALRAEVRRYSLPVSVLGTIKGCK